VIIAAWFERLLVPGPPITVEYLKLQSSRQRAVTNNFSLGGELHVNYRGEKKFWTVATETNSIGILDQFLIHKLDRLSYLLDYLKEKLLPFIYHHHTHTS